MSAKLVTGRFFMERVLPETAAQLARISAGAASTMELPDDAVLEYPPSARSEDRHLIA